MQTFAEVRANVETWQKVGEMLDTSQMPPEQATQPSDAERKRLRDWVRSFLTVEARARAGDPGPVVLRRLSNAEYTYTIRDLTGVESLQPAREFPVDGAAGEGFTNAGNALVMSPALLTKYLDAGKEIAAHAVLLPDGLRFSQHITRRDRTNEILDQIRAFYSQFTDSGGGARVNLQGIVFDTNQGGRLPLEKYLAATLAERDALAGGGKSVEAVAREHGLNARYLELLWRVLSVARLSESRPHDSESRATMEPSLLLDDLRRRWRSATPDDAAALAAEIVRWQQALWKFNSVGHIGKAGGPKTWMEPVNPITTRHEVKLKLAAPADGSAASNGNEIRRGDAVRDDAVRDDIEIRLYLTAGDVGDGNEQDFVVFERPRLVAPGRPDLLLRDVRAVACDLSVRREMILAQVTGCLEGAAEASAAAAKVDVVELAKRHRVDADALAAWLVFLGIDAGGPARIESHLTRKADKIAGYDFIQGWVGDDAMSVVANSSDQHVRIPGDMKPHSVAVHPSPTLAAGVGWRSPVAASLRVAGTVQHAHPECGNGVAWSLEVRRGSSRQRLAAGTAQGSKEVPVGPIEKLAVRLGDLVSLVISPRDGNHSCDLTAVDLSLTADGEAGREWNLARDVSPDVLADNPHADRFGNTDVWHFYTEPDKGESGLVIPAGSLLAQWQAATTNDERRDLAEQLQKLLAGKPPADKKHPDAVLHRQLTALGGPLVSAPRQAVDSKPGEPASPASKQERAGWTGEEAAWGLDPALFGRHPDGRAVESASLCVRAPAVVEIRVPADLAEGREFVTAGSLDTETGTEGSVQIQVLTTKPDENIGLRPSPVTQTNVGGPWTSDNRRVSHATPIVVAEASAARRRIERGFDAFRDLFPAALCYTKIVPVDEVVTLTLFHREDEHLRRLMLDDEQAAKLDRMWDELHYVSHDAIELVDAFEQLWQYATQDADPKVFEPLRQPIYDRAAAFRKLLSETEPQHLDALFEFAARAYRRPLTDAETSDLRALYRRLREQEIPHDEALRLTLARVLVSPAFLYRVEQPGPGAEPAPVSDWELASRLSYFLWSSLPDAELREVAASGRLHEPGGLAAQTRRMLRDPRVRRLATEFACQWLHIYDFDSLDEKSERLFPTFADLRGAMYEESIRFFTDLFQRDGSVLEILDADHTFLNEALARHYGIPGVTGPEWRRVDGARRFARGGILAQATTLAKQSGASRTSPILRGNWISEVLLGEKLPRPPKDVPQLPDTAPAGLTERQLIEKHSSDPACAKCHARIDPLGFALESFDAIGRFRERDTGDLPIDARTTLLDGTELNGLDGLRSYLLTARRDDFLRQFCRKLLGYALGRAVQLSDEPLSAEMQAELKGKDSHFAAAVETIVLSKQFQMVRGRDATSETEPAER
jgi:hypothetical protein